MKLTKRQTQVYHLLKHRWAQEGRQPGLSELAEDLGIHYVSLKQHLEALATKGYLSLEPKGKGRSPVVTLKAPEHLLALVGEIAAGGLHDAEQHVEGYLKLPARGQFALRVRGDSMAGYLLNGDVVALRQGAFKNGDVCAAYVDGATTLKYVYRYQNHAVLRPHNPDYSPIEVSLDELHIQGVLSGVIRGELIPLLLNEGKEHYVN